jgi:hypothetical protein
MNKLAMVKALKWKLIRHAPLIVSVAMLGLALAGVVAAERY